MVPSVLSRRILPSEVRQCLGVLPVGVVADGDVELAVAAEVDRAAVVVGGGAEVGRSSEHHARCRGRRRRRRRREAAEPVVRGRARRRVVDVDVVVAAKLGSNADAQQPALVHGVDGQRRERRGKELAVPDHADAPLLQRHEESAARVERHRGPLLEAGRYEGVDEARRRCRDRQRARRQSEHHGRDSGHERCVSARACVHLLPGCQQIVRGEASPGLSASLVLYLRPLAPATKERSVRATAHPTTRACLTESGGLQLASTYAQLGNPGACRRR